MAVYILDNLAEYSEQDLERDLNLLPLWRREQALKYKFMAGKRDCTLSYLLLCQALQKEYGISVQPTFLIGQHGKPSLAEYPHIHFNLSHCAKAIACIIANRPVGIDVESTDRKITPSLMSYTMNEEEQRQIASEPAAFFRFWTQKEALVKLKGSGLQDHLHELLSSRNREGVEIYTKHHAEKGYMLSTAIEQEKQT